MKKILIFSYSNHKRDPRQNKQLNWLREHFKTVSLSYGTLSIQDVKHIQLNNVPNFNFVKKIFRFIYFLLNLFEKYYWKQSHVLEAKKILSSINYNIIIVHGIEALPVAVKYSKSAKIIFDAHEYYPEEMRGLKWKFVHKKYVDHICKTYLPRVDQMITVCQKIADKYKDEFDINNQVIDNRPYYHNHLLPLKVKEKHIRMIHHGGALPERKIEHMIQLMDYLDERFYLDLMLVAGNKQYIKYLKKLAENNHRINFINPVAYKDIVTFSNNYDIGLYILEPNNFNQRFALPNKFYEYIQSRLALAIGPSYEMSRVVQHYNLGVVASDFSSKSLANKLNNLSERDVFVYKQNSHQVAHQLSSIENEKKFLEIIFGV